ncbi:SRPBCC domain-containing protein [Nitratireductor sp. XY-223]|uniref:SRPBCC family protein n=1 Tax=Nitratireductor sp. XY-223 TaxID=2561926 RepID=UPI0010AAC242|nr:SRPBCC domain-containing protein [Nitratireductor sp. XY-223]
MTTVIDDQVLYIERTIAAPPDKVFDAWINPDMLIQWWGPEGMSIPKHNLDVREGGSWETTMRNAEGGEVIVSGIYKAIDRPNRLVFTWAWHQPDGSRGEETEITVTFEAVDRGTKMKLDQRAFAEVSNRDNHRMGWDSSFNCLDKLFE